MPEPMETASVSPRPALPTRVLCVDDSPDITTMMRMVIDGEPTMQCVGCLASADHLIEKVRRLSPPPDTLPLVVLLDATMPGKSPMAAMSALAAEFPAIRTIIYSGHHDPGFIDRAKAAGAWGCVSKGDEPDVILRAVREVAGGNAWWPPLPKSA